MRWRGRHPLLRWAGMLRMRGPDDAESRGEQQRANAWDVQTIGSLHGRRVLSQRTSIGKSLMG